MAAGVAVLHPQDVFNHRDSFRATKSRRRFTNPNTPHASSNPTVPAVNIVNRRSPRKRSPTNKDAFPAKEVTARKPKSKTNSDARPITASNKLVMGQVKILRRGEVLSHSPPSPPLAKSPPKSAKFSHVNTVSNINDTPVQDRMTGPPAEPVLTSKQIRFSDCYAGLTIDVSSPPPSSLPVPDFFRKKLENNISTTDNTSDATNDLLKLLRLDLS